MPIDLSVTDHRLSISIPALAAWLAFALPATAGQWSHELESPAPAPLGGGARDRGGAADVSDPNVPGPTARPAAWPASSSPQGWDSTPQTAEGAGALPGPDNRRYGQEEGPPTPTTVGVAGEPSPYGDAAQPIPMRNAEILARIGSEVILGGDIYPAVEARIERDGHRVGPHEMEQYRAVITWHLLNQAIRIKLVYVDARRSVPAEALKHMEEELAKAFRESVLPNMKRHYEASNRQELDVILAEEGSSIERHRRQFIEAQIAQMWEHQQVGEDPEITHAEMLAYYEQNVKDFERPARVRWEELVVRIRRFPSRQEAYTALARMGNQVIDGRPFEEVARELSQGTTAHEGGRRDWTHRGVLVAKAVDHALFALPVGQLSPIIDAGETLHIVRVVERDDGGTLPFTEAQVEIRNKLQTARQFERLQDYVERLQRQIPIWTVFDESPSEAASFSRAPRPEQPLR